VSLLRRERGNYFLHLGVSYSIRREDLRPWKERVHHLLGGGVVLTSAGEEGAILRRPSKTIYLFIEKALRPKRGGKGFSGHPAGGECSSCPEREKGERGGVDIAKALQGDLLLFRHKGDWSDRRKGRSPTTVEWVLSRKKTVSGSRGTQIRRERRGTLTTLC